MRNHVITASAAALLAVACGLGCSGTGSGGGGGSAVVASAASQSEARSLARESDLPAIATADRLVVTDATGKTVTATAPADLDAARAALTLSDIPPSGGETWAMLQWFQGETKVRELWVYADGEWGVHRPGTSWTLGRSAALVTAVKGILNDG